jgi:hypothetical protein
LGDFGVFAEPALPALIKAVSDEGQDVGWVAGNSLSKIATALRDAGRTDAIEPLQNAASAMQQSNDPRVQALAPTVTDAVAALKGDSPP